MGFFANLTAKLEIDTSQFNKGLRAASAAVTRFSKQVAKDFRDTSKSAARASDSFKILGRAADKGYKSVRRITQGIIVSQAFYRTIHAIQDTIRELYNFSQAVEENRIAFAGLIRDADKAKRLNETLQDLAAATPYTYEQAVDNARMLLAYEFPLQSMERIMRDIADATAASGKIESYKNIAAALGQIQGKGRLTARELIRFATAGIPVYQILREELGLTHEQLVNIGKLHIPADIAIPAILRGMEKRYAGAAAAMQRTTKGLTNAIRENILIISQNVFDPLYQNLRVNMEKLSNRLEAMREDIRKGGFGYMLANMFPPEIVQRIQLFAANIQMLIQNIAAMLKALAPVGRAFTELFINTFNAIMPFINMFTRVLAVLMQMLTSNSTAVRIFVSALGGLFIIYAVVKLILGFRAALKSLLIVKLVAQGIIYLGKAIGYLTMAIATNPLAAFVGLAVGGLLAMTLASKKFGSAVDGLMGKVSGAFGVDPSKIFVPKMEENTKIADEFNQQLELSSEGLEEIGNKAKEAGKKAKQALMTFDEVFVLPDPDAAGAEGLDDILDISDIIEAPTIPPFNYSEMFPDVGASITEWTQGIADSIRDKLTKALIGAGIGAVIGSIIGGIFGGLPGAVLGAKIGAAAGAIAGLFWEKLVEFFKSPTGIGATLGAIIGGIIGGPIGAAVGAILGGVAGGIVGHFWDELKVAFENSTVRGATLGAALGALIGFAFGGPLGAGIGAVIGGSLGAIVGHFWEDLVKAFESDAGRGAVVGASIGTLIGSMIGGPMGAALGAVLGGVIGGLLPSFWEHVTEWYKESKATFDNWWSDTKDGFVSWKDETVASIVEWKSNTVTDISNWYNETKTKLSDWWSETKTGFSNWYDETKIKLGDWWSETKTGFSNWYDETKIKLGDWWSETKTEFTNWKDNTGARFKEWKEDTFSKVSTWASETHSKFSDWWEDTTTGLSTWWGDTKTGFNKWKEDTFTSVSEWYSDTKGKFSDWWGETYGSFSKWWDDSKEGFSKWAKGIYDDVVGWFDDMRSKIKSFFDDLKFWKKEAEDTGSRIASTSLSRDGSGFRVYSMDPVTIGHAKGGTFKKEHIARINEGNKMETILPIENPSAMAKVRQAIFGGEPIEMFNRLVNDIISMQPSPIIYGGNQQPTPVYVGTLIADERGLRELERKLYDIRIAERHRRGE
jgi:tape measure domain-containing protein